MYVWISSQRLGQLIYTGVCDMHVIADEVITPTICDIHSPASCAKYVRQIGNHWHSTRTIRSSRNSDRTYCIPSCISYHIRVCIQLVHGMICRKTYSKKSKTQQCPNKTKSKYTAHPRVRKTNKQNNNFHAGGGRGRGKGDALTTSIYFTDRWGQ